MNWLCLSDFFWIEEKYWIGFWEIASFVVDDVVEGVTVVVVVVVVVDDEVVVLDVVVNDDETIVMSSNSDMGASAAANKGSFWPSNGITIKFRWSTLICVP